MKMTSMCEGETTRQAACLRGGECAGLLHSVRLDATDEVRVRAAKLGHQIRQLHREKWGEKADALSEIEKK